MCPCPYIPVPSAPTSLTPCVCGQTYASFMRCFGFILLNYKIWTVQSVKGVSVKTVQLYAVVFVTRLMSILRHSGYLPYGAACVAVWSRANHSMP